MPNPTLSDLADLGEIPPSVILLMYLSEHMDLEPTLPEIFAVLGEELTVQFLRVFSGRVIKVPSVKEIREAYSAIQSYQQVEKHRASGATVKASVKRVSECMDLTESQVLNYCMGVRGVLKTLKGSVSDGQEPEAEPE